MVYGGTSLFDMDTTGTYMWNCTEKCPYFSGCFVQFSRTTGRVLIGGVYLFLEFLNREVLLFNTIHISII